MFYIDFQGGTHGNYLEFVCNKFLGNVKTRSDTPFNSIGAAHKKCYVDQPVFESWHYFDFRGVRTVPDTGDIISIRISPDDLLPVQSISLLRASNRNYDSDLLETNTANKLDNADQIDTLNNLTESFFKNQVKDSYNAVKDPSWPDIATLDDYKNLPQWIRNECENYHNLYLIDFSSGNCPRWILREFFKIGFANPEQSGFIQRQASKMYYSSTNRVYNFPFASFYNTQMFQEEMQKVAAWCNLSFTPDTAFNKLHKEFLKRQPYANSKNECDVLIHRIINGENFVLPDLYLFKESYICAMLEKHYKKEWPTGPNSWFTTAQQIRNVMTNQK